MIADFHLFRENKMSKYTTEALRSVALVGHGAAGKTSLAEALLFATNAIAARAALKKATLWAIPMPRKRKPATP